MKKIILLMSITVFFLGCTREIPVYSDSDFVLGTICSIKIWGGEESLLDKSFEILEDAEQRFSVNIPTSEISAINAAAGKEAVVIDDITMELLTKAVELAEKSNGRFDITAGPLIDLWAIGTEDARIPTEQEINAVLPLINYKNLILDSENNTAFLKEKGMKIDVGGIAKGFAADLVRQVLKDGDVKRGIINLGGNVLLINEKPTGPWRVGVQHPDQSRGTTLGIIESEETSVVTSGKYERFFLQDGIRYHHIFDLSTGYPVENGIASVSIVVNNSMLADALSTSIFALGLDNAFAFQEREQNFDMIIVMENNKVYLSKGLESRFELSAEEFILDSYPPTE